MAGSAAGVKRTVPGLQPARTSATRGPYFGFNCCGSPAALNLNTSPAERFYLTEVAPLLSFVAEETLEEVKGGGLTI